MKIDSRQLGQTTHEQPFIKHFVIYLLYNFFLLIYLNFSLQFLDIYGSAIQSGSPMIFFYFVSRKPNSKRQPQMRGAHHLNLVVYRFQIF